MSNPPKPPHLPHKALGRGLAGGRHQTAFDVPSDGVSSYIRRRFIPHQTPFDVTSPRLSIFINKKYTHIA